MRRINNPETGKDISTAGQCFMAAWVLAESMHMDYKDAASRHGKSGATDITIVHAWVMGQSEAAGIRFVHAWVEFMQDGEPMIADMSKGYSYGDKQANAKLIPKEIYYRIGHVEVDSIRRYTYEEAQRNILDLHDGSVGPWDTELFHVCAILPDGTELPWREDR